MVELTVNGARVHAAADRPSLAFLPGALRLTAAKDGCSPGLCGNCTKPAHGKKTKCCKQRVSALVGRSILTAEGGQGHARASAACMGQGQIEGSIVMGLGFALAEDYAAQGGNPRAAFGMAEFMRAPATPAIAAKRVQAGCVPLPHAHGAKGVGKHCPIPTAPACTYAYCRFDGCFRNAPPLQDTVGRKGAA